MKRVGTGAHKEINRTNFGVEDLEERLAFDVVRKQLRLLRFRATHQTFSAQSNIIVESDKEKLKITWENENAAARLEADFRTYEFAII